MLNKSEKNKLRSTARKLAHNSKIKYEDALDHIAREKGFFNWKKLNNNRNNTGYEANISYGVENIKKRLCLKLNQIETYYLIQCCKSYIEVYKSLLTIKTINSEDISFQNELTEKILNQILSLANKKVNSNDETSIELEFSGYKLGQVLILLFDYGKTIELQLEKISGIIKDREEQYHLSQVGGTIGDILSRIVLELEESDE